MSKNISFNYDREKIKHIQKHRDLHRFEHLSKHPRLVKTYIAHSD